MIEEKPKEKRYALSTQEKENMERYRRIFDDLYSQQQGIRRMMDVELVKIQQRVGIINEKPAEGFQRNFTLDDKKMELVVIDIPVPQPGEGDIKITPVK